MCNFKRTHTRLGSFHHLCHTCLTRYDIDYEMNVILTPANNTASPNDALDAYRQLAEPSFQVRCDQCGQYMKPYRADRDVTIAAKFIKSGYDVLWVNSFSPQYSKPFALEDVTVWSYGQGEIHDRINVWEPVVAIHATKTQSEFLSKVLSDFSTIVPGIGVGINSRGNGSIPDEYSTSFYIFVRCDPRYSSFDYASRDDYLLNSYNAIAEHLQNYACRFSELRDGYNIDVEDDG